MLSYRTPVAKDVLDAAARLHEVAIETPIVRSDLLDEITGALEEQWLESCAWRRHDVCQARHGER